MNAIRVRVSHDGWNNMNYYKRFYIVDELPKVGGRFKGENVEDISRATVDFEGNSFDYEYYIVKTDIDEYGVAIEINFDDVEEV